MAFSTLKEVEKEVYTVCECMDVSLGEIIEAIKNGACDVEAIMEATDAGTACGKCRSKEDDPADERAVHLDEIVALAKAEGLCKD